MPEIFKIRQIASLNILLSLRIQPKCHPPNPNSLAHPQSTVMFGPNSEVGTNVNTLSKGCGVGGGDIGGGGVGGGVGGDGGDGGEGGDGADANVPVISAVVMFE